MTNDTKQLFDAPWEVGVCEKGNPEFESVFIASKTGCLIGCDMEEETANRVVHLPELYDALMDSVFKFCESCLVKRGMLDEEHPDYDLIEHGCPNKTGKSRVVSCVAMKWIELLQKVRDGE